MAQIGDGTVGSGGLGGFAICIDGDLVVAGEGVDGIKGDGYVGESKGRVCSEGILTTINTTVQGNIPDDIKKV